MALTSEEFTCELCGGTFIKAWTDVESVASAIINGHPPSGDDGFVCDKCYPEFMEWFRKEVLKL